MSEFSDNGTKPEELKAVRIWLEDGTRIYGMWTGESWWSTRGEVQPIWWELQENATRTQEIRDSLERQSA